MCPKLGHISVCAYYLGGYIILGNKILLYYALLQMYTQIGVSAFMFLRAQYVLSSRKGIYQFLLFAFVFSFLCTNYLL